MKKQLLLKFSTFMVAAILFSVKANAQIVYTDVNPDSTMYCTSNCTLNYNLDLNNDTNNDFILTTYRYAPPQHGISKQSHVTASPLNGNAIKDTLVHSINVSIPLQFNTVIDSNLLLNQSWQASGPQSLKNGVFDGGSTDTVWGLWDSLTDYYLGLRILQSGQAYYGWVKLRVDISFYYASVVIKDYAFNSIPDQPILAGQTVATGINENSFASSINLFPNPATDKLTIDLGSNNKKVEVTITDMTGKIIYKTAATNSEKVVVNTSDIATGLYVVQIQIADYIATKKLVIEK